MNEQPYRRHLRFEEPLMVMMTLPFRQSISLTSVHDRNWCVYAREKYRECTPWPDAAL